MFTTEMEGEQTISQCAFFNKKCLLARYLLAIYFLIIIYGLSGSKLSAESSKSEARLKAENLPDVIRAEIIDTTQIQLHPRPRFNDPTKPQFMRALALYAKERRLNLPPALTPSKTRKIPSPLPQNYWLSLTAYPSLPNAFFYHATFAGRIAKTRGFLHLNRNKAGDGRTKGRGDYNIDSVRSKLTYQYREHSEISLGTALTLKNLNWLPTTPETSTFNKELRLVRSNLNWEHHVSQHTSTAVKVNLETLRLVHTKQGVQPKTSDQATDLRIKFDMQVPAPIQNPFHMGRGVDLNPLYVGADVEYFAHNDERLRRDNWSTIYRAYVRDEFTSVKDCILGIGIEAVSFREPDDLGQSTTHLHLHPYVAVRTRLRDQWVIRLRGQRTLQRAKLSDLYVNTDYISLQPFLRAEKTWDTRITLTHQQRRKFEVNISGFAKQIDDLVVLEPSPSDSSTTTEISWTPRNRNAWIYGGHFGALVHLNDRLEAELEYTHEVHKPEVGEWIPYRPNNSLDLNVTYHLPEEFYLVLGAKFRGVRHAMGTSDQTLENCFLLKPKISKIIEKYVGVFVGATFAIGMHTLLEKYELSQNILDFGIELRF